MRCSLSQPMSRAGQGEQQPRIYQNHHSNVLPYMAKQTHFIRCTSLMDRDSNSNRRMEWVMMYFNMVKRSHAMHTINIQAVPKVEKSIFIPCNGLGCV